jgi:hypothetical protein
VVVFHGLPVAAISDVMLNHDGIDGTCKCLMRALDVCEGPVQCPWPHLFHQMMGYAAYCHGENDLENKAAFQTARNVNVGFAGNCI